MRSDINLQNNDLNNGYIFKELVERIDKLEKQNKEIMSLIEESTTELTISIKDYLSIVKTLKTLTTIEEFEKHINDIDAHGKGGKTEVSNQAELNNILSAVNELKASLNEIKPYLVYTTDITKIINKND